MKKLFKEIDFELSFKVETDIEDKNGKTIHTGRYYVKLDDELGFNIVRSQLPYADMGKLQNKIRQDYVEAGGKLKCGNVFETASGAFSEPCHRKRNHHGMCQGYILGSTCNWPNDVKTEYELNPAVAKTEE